MEVRFASRALERRAASIDAATRAWGPVVARRYIQRINLLTRTPTFADLFAIRALRLHPLIGGRSGQHALALTGRWRLIVRRLPDEKAVLVEEVTHHYGD